VGGLPAMLENYVPIILFMSLALGLAVLLLVLGRALGPHKPSQAKSSPYECGFEAFEDARMKFDVRFYLVAILLFFLILK
jgi:NADH-quinone oxidoreductase subunit A